MLAPDFLPVWSGVGAYIVELAKHLPKNIEIHVVTSLRTGFGNDKISTLDYDFSKFFASNVHIHFICRATDTFVYNGIFQYNCLKQVPKIVREYRIDLLLSHTAHMPDLLLLLRKLNVPVVTTIHTTIKSQRMGTLQSGKNMSGLEKSEKATWILYPFLRFMEEVYFRQRRFFITPSHWMKRWFQENHSVNGTVRVIPNSIDINEYTPDLVKGLERVIPQDLRNKRIVLYAGRLVALKGVGILLNAIPQILKKYAQDDLLFVFAGPGNQAEYFGEAKRMGIESHCLFTGPLHRENVKKLMASAEVVVVPSYVENAPYTVLESMACGTPVIASRVGGMSEIIRSGVNGMLIPPGSKNELEKSAIMILEDNALRDRIGHEARKTIIDEFSWSTNARRHVEFYSDAINHSA